MKILVDSIMNVGNENLHPLDLTNECNNELI